MVVECGAGSGENTVQLVSLQQDLPFRLHVITDGRWEDSLLKDGLPELVSWTNGISYRELPKLPAGSVDLCIIDTDHNYWTLDSELMHTDRVLRKRGVIAMHDTATYDHNSGIGHSYACGESYPNAIHQAHHAGKHMGDALRKFMQDHPDYRVLAKSDESHGAVAIQKQ